MLAAASTRVVNFRGRSASLDSLRHDPEQESDTFAQQLSPSQLALLMCAPQIEERRHREGGHIRHNWLHEGEPVEGEASYFSAVKL